MVACGTIMIKAYIRENPNAGQNNNIANRLAAKIPAQALFQHYFNTIQHNSSTIQAPYRF